MSGCQCCEGRDNRDANAVGPRRDSNQRLQGLFAHKSNALDHSAKPHFFGRGGEGEGGGH